MITEKKQAQENMIKEKKQKLKIMITEKKTEKNLFYIQVKFRGVFETQSNISEGTFCKKSEQMKIVNKLSLKCLSGF